MLEDTIVVEDPAMTCSDDTCGDGATTWVVLAGWGDKKIQVINELRSITNFGLRESKDLVENAPSIICVPDGAVAAARLAVVGADAYPLKRGHIEVAIGLVQTGARTDGYTTEVSAVLASIKGLDLRDPKIIAMERQKKYSVRVRNKLTVFQKGHPGGTPQIQSFLDAITCSETQEDGDAITCSETQEDSFFARLKYLQSLVDPVECIEASDDNPTDPRYDLTLPSSPPTTVRGMGILPRPNPEECENLLRAIWAEMRAYVNELRKKRGMGECNMTFRNPDYGNTDGRENPHTWVRDEYLEELEELIEKGDELSSGAAVTAAVEKIVNAPEYESWYDWQASHKNGYEDSWAVMENHWSTKWPPDVEKIVVIQDDPDGPAHLEIHYQSATSNPEKLIAELAGKYPTLVFVESYAMDFLDKEEWYGWGANVYIDGESFYVDENHDSYRDRVLGDLVAKMKEAVEADNSGDPERHRVMDRLQVLANRSETDAKAVADLAVSGLT